MSNDRIEWIDTLKAIGILSVILGHIQTPFTTFIFFLAYAFIFLYQDFSLTMTFLVESSLVKTSKD